MVFSFPDYQIAGKEVLISGNVNGFVPLVHAQKPSILPLSRETHRSDLIDKWRFHNRHSSDA